MKSTLFRLLVGTALGLGPVQAMYDVQEEDKGTLPQTKVLQQNTSRRETSASISLKKDVLFESLPDELFVSISSFLDVSDFGRMAQASTHLKKLIENPELWRYMGTKYYGDYLSEENLKENPKKKVVYHYLSVLVNMTGSLKEIERLVRQYSLNLYVVPFKKHIDLSFLLALIRDHSNHNELITRYDELIAQGNKVALEREIDGFTNGTYGFARNLYRLRELNELLVAKGDSKAIQRKIDGLSYGNPRYYENLNDYAHIYRHMTDGPDRSYGYEKDPVAARELNELLVVKSDQVAIERKIEGLLSGKYGYERDSATAKEFNESLVNKGNSEGIKRKIVGLANGEYGYEKNPAAAKELNEMLSVRGDQAAIKRKIEGLLSGKYGYEIDSAAAREFNESLVNKGNSEGIKRKIVGLADGEYGYEKNPVAAREFNEFLIKKGDQEAITRKIEGIEKGRYGYERDLTALKKLNESLVEKSDQGAINRKIEGFFFGFYGYEKNFFELRGFNDSLIEKGDSYAIMRKIQGLYYAGNGHIINSEIARDLLINEGYKKKSEIAREFIEDLLMNENSIARAMGKYIKAFAMKYGISGLGYEKDAEKAIEFIKNNHVPY